jgi:hypothetical protein
MDERHRTALDDATADDERWESLAGHLYDPAHHSDDLCPDDDTAEVIAERYAFTTEGRLFYLRKDGGVSERKPSHGQFNLQVHGTRWQPRVKALMRRVYPTVLVGEYDLEEYDLKDDEDVEELLEHLKPKTRPERAHIEHRRLS